MWVSHGEKEILLYFLYKRLASERNARFFSFTYVCAYASRRRYSVKTSVGVLRPGG